jgi:integrase/recombinase XerD
MKPSSYLVLLTVRQKRNGKYPVKLRITHQRLYRDYKTGIDMTEEEFNEANSPKPRKQFRHLAITLNEVKSKANKIIGSLKVFTYQKFEDAYYGHISTVSDLYSIFKEYVEVAHKEDRIKTAMSYQTAANSLKIFSPKATIHDVDAAFLKKYHAYLESKGKSTSTIGIYMRSLRAVYNYAISKGMIQKNNDYPFVRSKYIIPSSTNIKKTLSANEISKLLKHPCADKSFADRSKDFWLFSYLCNGINFKDIALLKKKNIDGNMLRFVREKTKRTSQSNQKMISCYLSDESKEIIEKWGKESGGNGEDYIFDIVSESDTPEIKQKKIDQFVQVTNKNLKRICKAVGIDKPVTTYYSRHTAATTLKRSGASILEIQEALGHSTPVITQKYLDSFEDDTKKELSIKLIKNLRNESEHG